MYFNKASPSFQSYMDKRGKRVEELVEGINGLIPFYDSIRKNTLKIKEYEKEIRAAFYAIKYLYPEASFPDVYFFIWYIMNSGSTTSEAGLLIATETHTIGKNPSQVTHDYANAREESLWKEFK